MKLAVKWYLEEAIQIMFFCWTLPCMHSSWGKSCDSCRQSRVRWTAWKESSLGKWRRARRSLFRENLTSSPHWHCSWRLYLCPFCVFIWGLVRITDQQASQYWANIEWGCGDGLIQVPPLTGQPSVDVELFENNALSTPGRTVGCGTWIKSSPQPHSILAQYWLACWYVIRARPKSPTHPHPLYYFPLSTDL